MRTQPPERAEGKLEHWKFDKRQIGNPTQVSVGTLGLAPCTCTVQTEEFGVTPRCLDMSVKALKSPFPLQSNSLILTFLVLYVLFMVHHFLSYNLNRSTFMYPRRRVRVKIQAAPMTACSK